MNDMIEIRFRAFALVRQIIGQGDLPVQLAAGSTVNDLLAVLTKAHADLPPLLERMIITVNQRFAERDQVLNSGDEVALFPPVSGGADDTLVGLAEEPLDHGQLINHVTEPGAGAVVSFCGTVRDNNLGRQVDFLEYEAYPEMAEAKLRQVVAEAREQWPLIRRVAIVHRVGHLDLGETAVLVAVGAPHRNDGAFEAARFMIDRIKEIVPIWKKEGWSEGADWLEGEYQPHAGE